MDKLFKFFGKNKGKQEKKEPDVRNINSIVVGDCPQAEKNSQSKGASQTHHTESEGQIGIKFDNCEIKSESAHYIENSANKDDSLSQAPLSQYNFSPDPDDPKANDVVLVNPGEKDVTNKAEGFYYKKYIDRIQKLQLSNPILIEREKMKVNFDSEVMDYLVNDMSLLFKEKQVKIDNSQVEIMKEVQETKDLIGILSDIHSDSTFNYNLDFFKQQKKLMNEIDYLEVVVNTLNIEADNLVALVDKIEKNLDICEKENI